MTDSALARAAQMKIIDFDPYTVIEAVNMLQPLGKKEAISVLENFIRDSDELNQGLFWVLRCLFDVNTNNGHPPVRIGQPIPDFPKNENGLPRFPVILIQDVPLMLVGGYTLGGFPENVSTHLSYYKEHGFIRTSQLYPDTDNLLENTMKILKNHYEGKELERLPAWLNKQIERYKAHKE